MTELTRADEPTGGDPERAEPVIKLRRRPKARAVYPGLSVLQTESKDGLAKLLDEAIQEIGPSNFIERRYVEDVVSYIWDIMRYRRIINGLLNNALREAIVQIVRPTLGRPRDPLRFVQVLRAAQDTADEWMLFKETKRRVSSLLKESGLDESAFEAEAFRGVAEHLERTNRMLQLAEAGRDRALRSIVKYRKNFADKVRRYSDLTVAADPSVVN